jgi:hypothetical protein
VPPTAIKEFESKSESDKLKAATGRESKFIHKFVLISYTSQIAEAWFVPVRPPAI